MTRRILMIAAAILTFSLSLFAAEADFIIPAAGSGPGALGSRWQSEVTLYNSSTSDMDVALSFHDITGEVNHFTVTIPAHSTTSLDDIVATRFGLAAATGAIVIDVTDDSVAENLAVSSRTYNVSSSGEFGQDIPAIGQENALGQGFSGIITGPSNAAQVRLNFGIYALDAATVEWTLRRRDGTVVNTVTQSYQPGTQVQYVRGVETFFTSTPQNNDIIQADVLAGHVMVYGSAVNNLTGDPTFVPSARIRETANVEFLGLDLDENGSIDVQAHNGVLDRSLNLSTSLFPSFFRVVAREITGKTLTYTLVGATRNDGGSSVDVSHDVALRNGNEIEWAPGSDSKGKTGTLTVRVSDGAHSADLIIPVIFK